VRVMGNVVVRRSRVLNRFCRSCGGRLVGGCSGDSGLRSSRGPRRRQLRSCRSSKGGSAWVLLLHGVLLAKWKPGQRPQIDCFNSGSVLPAMVGAMALVWRHCAGWVNLAPAGMAW
jgi:hypothetical protein